MATGKSRRAEAGERCPVRPGREKRGDAGLILEVDESRLVTAREAARIVGRSVCTVQTWARAGVLEAADVGVTAAGAGVGRHARGVYLYRLGDVVRLAAERPRLTSRRRGPYWAKREAT